MRPSIFFILAIAALILGLVAGAALGLLFLGLLIGAVGAAIFVAIGWGAGKTVRSRLSGGGGDDRLENP